jgi:hypothetical protein
MQEDAEVPGLGASQGVRRRSWNTLYFLVAVVVLGGGAIIYSMLSSHAVGRPQAVSSQPQVPPADCFWSLEAQAWVDTNGNDVWDKLEEPLAGVRFRLHGYTAAVSDSDGMGKLFIFPAACSGVEYAVSALPPPGYQPTTDQPLRGRGVGNVGKVSFGFRHVR